MKGKHKICDGLDLASSPQLLMCWRYCPRVVVQQEGIGPGIANFTTDAFTVEWAARIRGSVEGLMSPGTPLKETSCPRTLPLILSLVHLVPPHVPANMTFCLIPVSKVVDTRDRGLNSLNPQTKIHPLFSCFSQEFPQRDRNQHKV